MKVKPLMRGAFVLGLVTLVVPPVGIALLLTSAGLFPYREDEFTMPLVKKGLEKIRSKRGGNWILFFVGLFLLAVLPFIGIMLLIYWLWKYIKGKKEERRAVGQIVRSNTSKEKDRDQIAELQEEIAQKQQLLKQIEQQNENLQEQKMQHERIERERPRLKHYNDLTKKKLEEEVSDIESLRIKRLEEEIRQLKQDQKNN